MEDSDLRSHIDVSEYSDLLRSNMEIFDTIKWDFDELHNIRRDWHEGVYEYSIDTFVREFYSKIARKYNLSYVVD